jgi:hypothetical protein
VEGREEPKGTIPLAEDAAVDELELAGAAAPPSLFPSLWLAGPPYQARAGGSLSRPRAGPRWRVGLAQWSLFYFEILVSLFISQI